MNTKPQEYDADKQKKLLANIQIKLNSHDHIDQADGLRLASDYLQKHRSEEMLSAISNHLTCFGNPLTVESRIGILNIFQEQKYFQDTIFDFSCNLFWRKTNLTIVNDDLERCLGNYIWEHLYHNPHTIQRIIKVFQDHDCSDFRNNNVVRALIDYIHRMLSYDIQQRWFCPETRKNIRSVADRVEQLWPDVPSVTQSVQGIRQTYVY